MYNLYNPRPALECGQNLSIWWLLWLRWLSVNSKSIKKEIVLGEADLIRGVFKSKLHQRDTFLLVWKGRTHLINCLQGLCSKEIWALARSPEQLLANNSKKTGFSIIHLQGNEFCWQLVSLKESQMRTAAASDTPTSAWWSDEERTQINSICTLKLQNCDMIHLHQVATFVVICLQQYKINCVPIKLQKQGRGWIWPVGSSLLMVIYTNIKPSKHDCCLTLLWAGYKALLMFWQYYFNSVHGHFLPISPRQCELLCQIF